MRRYRFASKVSAAESFRSTCDSERSTAEWSMQRFPVATPHVGHGTENNCSGVRSFILTGTGCDKTSIDSNRRVKGGGPVTTIPFFNLVTLHHSQDLGVSAIPNELSSLPTDK